MISGAVEVTKFVKIYLILEVKFGEDTRDWLLFKNYIVKFEST